MTRQELDEAVMIGHSLLAMLRAALSGQYGREQMTVRNAIGFLDVALPVKINTATLGKPLFNCFELTRVAGATRIEMDKIRVDMLARRFRGLPAVAIAFAGIQFSLIEQVRIIAETTFTSREDVDAMMLTMNAAFEPAEEFAADVSDDPSIFQAMITLHSALTRNLVALARPLPRVIQYRFTKSMPSLVLANRIYANARRADELRMENKIVHPAFMPRNGRCLSN